MIIGLAGRAGSGKDTVGAYLIKEYGFERKAFADPLKRSVAALFDIPFSEIDKLKLDQRITVEVGEFVNGDISGYHVQSMTFRSLLQRYGTEAHRDIFGEDFWVDVTLPVGGYYPGRAIVITDVRFQNEVERIRFCGGITCLIRREAALENQDHHRSESTELNVDYVINNDGTLNELYEKVEKLIEHTATVVGERRIRSTDAR